MFDPSPYFFDGRLHLPKSTLDAIIPHGIDVKTAKRIRKGVALDDVTTLKLIVQAVEAYTEAAPDSPVAIALRQSDVKFMLTGTAA